MKPDKQQSIDWYFDFISPFAWFGFQQLEKLPKTVKVNYRPVLFAGLLNHWGHKGPAEIPSKRQWTYRWCVWWAQQHEIPFKIPAAHPFNPLPYLRLAHATGCDSEVIESIFTAIWATGADPADAALLESLMDKWGIDPETLQSSMIKQRVREATDEAIGGGVFGVPTSIIDGELFWGADSLEFMQQYLDNPALFADADMRAINTLPSAADRNK